MANRKMWDWFDKAEGRKDGSFNNLQKVLIEQGYKKRKKRK